MHLQSRIGLIAGAAMALYASNAHAFWNGWRPLGGGGVMASKPVVSHNQDGRPQFFARGNDGALWSIWESPDGTWTAPVSFGGSIVGDPAVVFDAQGRIEVFAESASGTCIHIAQNQPNGAWGPWDTSVGGSISNPVATTNSRGQIQLFANGGDGRIWTTFQQTNGSWAWWGPLSPSALGRPAVGKNSDGRLEVFALDGGHNVQHIAQLAPSGGWPSAWSSLGGTWTSDPVVSAWNDTDGHLEVFETGTNGRTYHNWQNGGGWHGWDALCDTGCSNPGVHGLTVGAGLSGVLFGLNAANQLVESYDSPHGWTSWSVYDSTVSGGFAVDVTPSGWFLYARASDGTIWRR